MFNLQTLVRANILSLKGYSSARHEYTGQEGVFLDANENPFGTLNRYPDPYQAVLKNKIAELKQADARQIFLGNGSDEIIDLVYRIFCEPGKSQALTFTPTYGMYEVSACINQVELLTIELDRHFQIDKKAVAALLNNENLRVIFICSPNNPTGNNLHGIQFLLENFNGIVVVDEAYADFSAQPSWINFMKDHENLIVLQTFSKAWGMAGVRVGMAFAQANIIQLFNKVKPPYNISSLNQQAVMRALENVDGYATRLSKILEERTRLINALSACSFIQNVYPTEANFVLIKLKDADGCYEYLTKEKIIVRNRNAVISGCLRITIGTKQQNNKLIKAIKKYEEEKGIIY